MAHFIAQDEEIVVKGFITQHWTTETFGRKAKDTRKHKIKTERTLELAYILCFKRPRKVTRKVKIYF